MHACEHFDERGFSRAILAHQRVNLASAHCEIHALERLHSTERLADSAHL